MSELENRVEKLEHLMYGNGEKGAMEILRNIERDQKTLSNQITKEIKPKVDRLEGMAWKAGGALAAVLIVIQLIGLVVKVFG